METLLKDITYGLRMLIRRPGFTAVAVCSLALGIGANIAIFSLVDAVLLRPLPYPNADRLAMIWEDASAIGFPHNNVSPANYADWKAQNQSFEGIAASYTRSMNLTGDGEPEKLNTLAVTSDFFSVMEVKPILGRALVPSDDDPATPFVAILNYGFWQRRFGGDPNMVGKEIVLNGIKVPVVGVMPRGFDFLGSDTDLWVPAAFTPNVLAVRGSHYLDVVGRLKPGVTQAQALAEINIICQRIARTNPGQVDKDLRVNIIPMREQIAGSVRQPLIVLLIAVGCVLLIACANVANLLLSRATARKREIAVRAALGASRTRLVRQLLTESILISGLGGVVGLFFASACFGFLKRLIPDGMTLFANLGLDQRLLAYTIPLTFLTGIIFGLAPALQAAKVDLNESLKQGGKSGSAAGQGKLRNTLVVAEVALALVLLIGAGLFIRTFISLRQLDPGLNPANVLTVRTDLPGRKFSEVTKRIAFYNQVLDRVRTLPGVVNASYTSVVPLIMKGGTSSFLIEGHEPPQADASNRKISPDYFRVLGIPLRRGRFFDDHDDAQSQPVGLINETMARQFWPNEDPIGKHFKTEDAAAWSTVVGIVGDVKQMGLQAPVKAEMYFPYKQLSIDSFLAPRDLIIKTNGDPINLASAVRREIWAVDPAQPVSNIRTMEEILDSEVTQQRLAMSLLAGFAGLALLLASIGIYGVLSYTVTQRTQEIGIRMALGAQPGSVLKMVVGDGMRMSMLGVGIGLAAALALTRLMSSLLFGVTATDPTTFVIVPAILVAVSLLASYIPARRATRVDPMIALRYE